MGYNSDLHAGGRIQAPVKSNSNERYARTAMPWLRMILSFTF